MSWWPYATVPRRQRDLFEKPPQYPGWKPDPMSAEAHRAFWELETGGVTSLRVEARLFRGSFDPWLAGVNTLKVAPTEG